MDDVGAANVLTLASNEVPFDPLPSVLDTVGRVARGINRYPDAASVLLREKLAARLEVGLERVAVGCGSVGLLQQICLAYVNPGDRVLFGDPSFEAYPLVARLADGTASPIPNTRCSIDPVRITEAIDERTRVVFIANANNPTGTALRRAALASVIDATPSDCLVVIDEAYREFADGADVPDAVCELLDRPNVVALRTFSKAYGLAALRVGYLVGAPDVVETLQRVQLPFTVNLLAQAAAIASLDAEHELAERVALVRSERERVESTLRDAGFGVPDSQANFVWLPTGMATAMAHERLLAEGLLTRAFAGQGVRVTVGSPSENDRFLEACDRVLDDVGVIEAWQLPVGDLARSTNRWVERLRAAERRLASHAGEPRPSGLTAPDPGEAERWDAGQVWAHIGELGDYWCTELTQVLASSGENPAFGRVKTNPRRLAAIENGHHDNVIVHFEAARRAMDRLRALVTEMDGDDWARAGTHSTLGVMAVPQQLQKFLVGHWEEHADQLDDLGGRSP